VRRLLLALVGLLVLTACGQATDTGPTAQDPGSPGATGSPSGSPAGSPTGAPTAIAHPGGPDDVLVRVEDCCGYVSSDFAVTQPPRFVLTGDGTLVFRVDDAKVRADAPAVLQTVRLADAEVAALLGRASDLGLLGPAPDYGRPMMTDLADTTVTITAAGPTHVHRAYALDADQTSGDPGAREHLVAFLDDLARAARSHEATAYVPAAVRIFAQKPWPGSRPGEPIAWPAAAGLTPADLVHDHCVISDDPAVVSLLAARGRTAFVSWAGRTFQLNSRAALPGDTCP
jgi:hypothetical protein